MKMKLKKLREQVIVITGASSGIGHTTARLAASQGARLMLAARSEGALQDLADQIRASGGDAHYVVADVSREQEVRRIAGEAVGRFGGFDTWVNNAGVGLYGHVLDTPLDYARKLFETNFWGAVYGSRVACEHLRQRGGALINIGSETSDRAVPLQGFYSASKHALKGFTDALRMELEHEGTPVSVTLIKPSSIDTPYPQHAKNLMDEEPKLAKPVYEPELVAEAILRAAQKPIRDMFVGGGAKVMASMESISPHLADAYMNTLLFNDQKTEERGPDSRHEGLDQPSGGGKERGGHPGRVVRYSAYHEAVMHPLVASALGLGASLAVGALLRGRTKTNA